MGVPSEYSEVDKQQQDLEVKDRPVHVSVAGPLLPLVIQQGPRRGDEPGETWWLSKAQRAPAYLDLLYDLAIAAVLSVFGDKHQIMSAQSVLQYFSYFIIIWWVWASQCLYDARYQSNDWVHRLFKLMQLASFTYVGVFAQDFDPSYVVRPADITTIDAVAAVGGSRSFKGVALAYAVSRILLAVQYMYIACVTQKRYRRERLETFLIPIVTLLICAQFWIIAGLLSANAVAKIVLAYLALGLEVAITLGSGHLKKAIAPASGLLAERFADLTLVILAEGVLGLVKTLADVVSGFGLAAGGNALSAYSECFCCLVIVFGIWHFIFHAFNPEERFKSRRLAGAWAFLHLPLHFVILLVLSSMKNVAVYENVGGALNVLVPIFNQALNNTGETADIQLFDSTLDPEDILQFHKLDLQPGFLDEINRLNEQYLLAMGNHSIPYFDPYVDALQYGGQVLMVLAKTYDISFSQLTQDAYTNLSDVPRSWSNNDTQLEYQEDLAEEWYDYFVDVYSNDLMTPSLYFTPCAGALVILAALLTVFRTQGSEEQESAPDEIYGREEEDRPIELQRLKPLRSASFDSQWSVTDRLKKLFGVPVYVLEWVPLTIHLLIGIGLCLSAILDTAPSFDDDNAAFQILDAGWTLPIVALAYGVLIVADLIVLVIVRVVKGGPLLDAISRRRSSHSDLVLKSPPTTASLSSATLTSVLPMLPETPDLKIPHLSEEGPKTPLLSPHDDEGENEDDDRTEHDADGRSINDPSDAPIVESATDNSFARLYDGVPSAAPLHR